MIYKFLVDKQQNGWIVTIEKMQTIKKKKKNTVP
jgi:hypothetical protein